MKINEINEMIANGMRVGIEAITCPFSATYYLVNGEKTPTRVGRKLMANCPAGVSGKPKTCEYLDVSISVYNA
jgi:hypothetical protein